MHVISIMITSIIIYLCTRFCVESTMANRNEESARLAMDFMEDDLDFLDLALLAEHWLWREWSFEGISLLTTTLFEQFWQHFRFGSDDLLHVFHLLRIPERVNTEHRVMFSGMYMVVCVAVCAWMRFADLCKCGYLLDHLGYEFRMWGVHAYWRPGQ